MNSRFKVSPNKVNKNWNVINKTKPNNNTMGHINGKILSPQTLNLITKIFWKRKHSKMKSADSKTKTESFSL